MSIKHLLATALLFSTLNCERVNDPIEKSRNDDFCQAFNQAMENLRCSISGKQSKLEVLIGMKSSGFLPQKYAAALAKLLSAQLPYSESLNKKIDDRAKKQLSLLLWFPNFDAPTAGPTRSEGLVDKEKAKNNLNEVRTRLLSQFLAVMSACQIETPWTYKVILEKLSKEAELAKKINPESRLVKTMLSELEAAKTRLKKLK